MTTVTLEIPEQIKTRFGIGKKISYDNLIIKTIGKEYISPDLSFTDYDNLNKEHRKMYDQVENIDKNTLLNI